MQVTTKDIILWEILVPTIINDEPVTIDHHRSWDDKIRSISSGLTILKPAKGQWESPSGKLYIERTIPVRIACSEKEIDRIIDITIDHYDQEAVMAYKITDCVKIKYREDGSLGLGFMEAEMKRANRMLEQV